MKIPHDRSSKRKFITRLLFAVVILIILIGIYTMYGYSTKSVWPFKKNVSQTSEIRGVNDIDYSPPSQEEIEQSQTGKQNSASQDSSDQTGPTTTAKKGVSVGVSFADIVNNSVEVRAFVPSIIEGGGICTAEFTKNGKIVKETSSAFIDSSSSQCSPIYIATSSFPEKGIWSLSVSYSSDNAAGASEAMEVTL